MSRVPQRERRIDAFMSPLPLSVAPDVETNVAARLMREHGVHHLLVKDGDRLVGVLGETELELVGRVGGRWTCRQIVSNEPFVVSADSSFASVVEAMREKRESAAVVTSNDTIVGIVTTTDLLRALETAMGVTIRPLTPTEVRDRIRAEHVRIHSLLNDIERLSGAIVRGSDDESERLLAWVRGLGDALHAHLALEEEILVPLVRETAGFGDAHADEMLREHAEQRATIESILRDLSSTRSQAILAVGALELVKAIRDDIREEEETILGSDLLRDSLAASDA